MNLRLQRWPGWHLLEFGLWVLFGVGLLIFGFVGMGYCIVYTHSIPDGIWQKTQAPLRHGQIVSFCPPNTPVFRLFKERGYAREGNCPGNYRQFLKPIAALPGDTVEVSEAGVRVNGRLLRNSKQLKQDSVGRPMPDYPYGTYHVAPNTIWLVSHYIPESADARYFGPISMSAIISPMKPVWVAYKP